GGEPRTPAARDALRSGRAAQNLTTMLTEQAAAIGAQLDRLPATRSIWKLVLMLSLCGCFEYYNFFSPPTLAPAWSAVECFPAHRRRFWGLRDLPALLPRRSRQSGDWRSKATSPRDS